MPRPRFYRPPQPFSHSNLLLAYLPALIEVQRCSGGCALGLHPDLQRCAVTKQEKKNVTISMFPYVTKKKNVTIINHLECRCDCRVQATDCRPTQNYSKGICACVCRNENPKCNYKIKVNKQSS